MTETFGADLFAQTLLRAGVRQIFTLSGNHILPVFNACFEAGIKLIHTRHEARGTRHEAVRMADSWVRVMGEVGVVMVMGAPGHAHAVSALYTVRMAESSVVILSRHAANGQLGMRAFQEMDQGAVAAPLVKKASALRTFQTVPACKAICRHLESASRPLILTGPAFCTRKGRQRIAELESACGIPIACMESPRGINDPSLGAFAEVLTETDCVLLLGKRLNFTLGFWAAPVFSPRCRFMQIDPERDEIERTQQAVGDRLVTKALSDPGAALGGLCDCFTHEKRAAWTKEVESAVAYRPQSWPGQSEAGQLHAATVCAAIQPILDSDPEAVFVSDGDEFGQWSQARLNAPRRVMTA